MSSRLKLLLAFVAFAVLCFLLSRPLIEFLGERKSRIGQSAEDQMRPERLNLMSPDQVVRLINPKPSSTIVDLGAGFGLFTFPLAKAAGDTSKVYATDTDPTAISHLTDRSKKLGLKNVIPVRVQPDGLDAFYTQKLFDVIVVSDVIPLIEAPETFFSKLNPSLREESGRLWLVEMRLTPDFTLVEFSDAISLRNKLQPNGRDSVIIQRLSPETRKILDAPPSANDSLPLRQTVIRDLNRILEDATFWPDVIRNKCPLNQRETKLRESLEQTLEKAGVFKQNAVTGNVSEKETLRLLNRLVLQDMLGTVLWEQAFSIDNADDPVRSPWPHLLKKLTTGQDYPGLFRKAGYTLVQDHKELSYHHVLEFKR